MCCKIPKIRRKCHPIQNVQISIVARFRIRSILRLFHRQLSEVLLHWALARHHHLVNEREMSMICCCWKTKFCFNTMKIIKIIETKFNVKMDAYDFFGPMPKHRVTAWWTVNYDGRSLARRLDGNLCNFHPFLLADELSFFTFCSQLLIHRFLWPPIDNSSKSKLKNKQFRLCCTANEMSIEWAPISLTVEYTYRYHCEYWNCRLFCLIVILDEYKIIHRWIFQLKKINFYGLNEQIKFWKYFRFVIFSIWMQIVFVPSTMKLVAINFHVKLFN